MRPVLLVLLVGMLVTPTGPASATTDHPMVTVNPLFGDRRTRIVRVRTDAVVELPWATLADAGWELAAIPVAQIQVWRQGVQIPVQVTADGLAFVARSNTSRFSMDAAYWIGIGATSGLRTLLPEAPAAPVTWEPDMLYQSVAPTLRGDRWFAGELRTGGSALHASLTLPAALPAGTRIELALTPIDLRSDHHLTIHIGATTVGSVRWDDAGGGPRRLNVITAVPLPAGIVTLDLALGSDGADVVLVDALAIPDSSAPLPRLTLTLEHPHPAPVLGEVDQLMIAHPVVIPALRPLLEYKQRRGQRIAVVDVLAVYDAYSWGERDPEAIRRYIRTLSAQVQRPASVLLVGAGTARMRVAVGEGDPTLIPPYLIDHDPLLGEIACDSCYTRLDGDPVRDDPLPDIPIGRLPARTLAEAEVLVAKTLTALAPTPGAWQRRALVVTDNDRDAQGIPDPAGPFAPQIHQIAGDLPRMTMERFVYAPDQTATIGAYNRAALLRTQLFDAWDRGAGLITYIGHASPWQWAWTGPQEPVAHLLTRSDAVRTNAARLPLLISLTCLSGSFANPVLSSVDEELVRQPGGGVAAALAPGGSGVNTGHRVLAHALMPALESGATLGEAHLAGLAALVAQTTDLDLVFSYAILGDPDVRLPFATASDWTISLPEVIR